MRATRLARFEQQALQPLPAPADYYDGLNFGWGKLEDVRDVHNADSALRLMSELRTAGIRSHFWF